MLLHRQAAEVLSTFSADQFFCLMLAWSSKGNEQDFVFDFCCGLLLGFDIVNLTLMAVGKKLVAGPGMCEGCFD